MKIAVIFPGQGSQTVGMGQEFFQNFPIAKNVFERSDATLGFPLSDLCFNGPQSDLNLTANTQPALLTVSAAIASVLRDKSNFEVAFTAGHSLGEYSALWFAGCLSLETALSLVRTRGEAMQAATPPGMGSMAAVMGLSEDTIDKICTDAAEDQVLEPANFNGPGQVVISGHTEAVERGAEMAKSLGAKRSIILPVSAPFHCALMKSAAVRMKTELDKSEVVAPAIPVVNNVDAAILGSNPDDVRRSLIRQVTSSVKWEQSIQYMAEQGVSLFVEVGPGRVLTNLVKRIFPESERFAVGDIESLDKFIERVTAG